MNLDDLCKPCLEKLVVGLDGVGEECSSSLRRLTERRELLEESDLAKRF
jgi:hypothetical protein